MRCATCKQGALTLHRDPCNWQDVLNPGQVSKVFLRAQVPHENEIVFTEIQP